MTLVPTSGNAYLDSLEINAARFAQPLPRGLELSDVLLNQVRALAFVTGPIGLVISHAVAPVEQTQVIEVSPTILTQLELANLGAYQTALSTPGFVHAEDVDVVNAHLKNSSSAPYDVRLKKTSGAYVKWRAWGVTLLEPGVSGPTMRVSVLVKI